MASSTPAALRRVLGEHLSRWLALASALMFVALALWAFAKGLEQLIHERG